MTGSGWSVPSSMNWGGGSPPAVAQAGTTVTVKVLRTWLRERGGRTGIRCSPPGAAPAQPRRRRTTRCQTRDGRCCGVPVAQREARHPHTLRHSTAMRCSTRRRRLGDRSLARHESTETRRSTCTDMSMKERALARTALPGSPPGRYVARTPCWHSSTRSDRTQRVMRPRPAGPLWSDRRSRHNRQPA